MQIPQHWKDLLSMVQSSCPSAAIAGGALRDLWHNKQPKDIDVWLPVVDWLDLEKFEKDLKRLAMMCGDSELQTVKSCHYMDGNFKGESRVIYAVYHMIYMGMPVDFVLIGATPGELYWEAFDINICQIAYNGSLCTTEEFDKGIANKVLRVCNVNRLDRQNARLDRVAEKYPEYSVERLPDYSTEIILDY